MKSTLRLLVLPAIAAAAAAIPLTAGTQDEKPVIMDRFTVDGSKTHTLFMGADVLVGQHSDLYAVKDVSGSSWVVEVNGKTEYLSSRGGPLNIRITPELKLTEVSATLTGLKGTPSYTLSNDPSTKLTRDLNRAANLNAGYSAAMNQSEQAVTWAQNNASAMTGTNNLDVAKVKAAGGIPYPMTPDQGPTNENLQTAHLEAEEAVTMLSVGTDNEMSGDRGYSLGRDALDVTFGVSSVYRLNNPYVVIIARFGEKGIDTGLFKKLVFGKALDPIDSRPTPVAISVEGFPPAFVLKDFEVHLYNQGREIATNVCANRVEMTRQEAFEYVRTVYLGSHRDDTLPAVAVMGRLPEDLPSRLAGGEYRETFYVRVSRDGLAEEAFRDASCTVKVDDPYLESIVRSIRFKPALEKGNPVNGVATLKLGQLAI